MPPAVTDEQIRELARAVLQRTEYAQWRRGEVLRSWAEQLMRWLERFNEWMIDLSWSRPLLYWTIVGGLLLAAALLLAHVVWSIRVALSFPAPGAPAGVAPAPASFAAEAEALARQGRFLDAAHRLQLASIELLLRGAVIELSRSEPNRVLRRRLQTAPLPEPERGTLLRLVDELETRWFRDRTDDPDLYRSWHALHQRLGVLVRPA